MSRSEICLTGSCPDEDVLDQTLEDAIHRPSRSFARSNTVVIEAAIHLIQQGVLDVPDVKCVNIKQARAVLWNAAWLQEYLSALWREEGHLPPLHDDHRPSCFRTLRFGYNGTSRDYENSSFESY